MTLTVRTAATCLAIVLLAGCGTIRDAAGLHDQVFDEPGPHVFGGVRLSAADGAQEASGHLAPMCLFYWLSLPLDVVFDTLLLPWSIVRSADPEGCDYVTVDRAGLSDAIKRDRSSAEPGDLRYLGSDAGYHHLLIYHGSYAERRYRVREDDLRVQDVFQYTTDRSKVVALMRRNDPWPLPEPLRDRFKDRTNR